MMAMRIFSIAYSARIERMVVNDAGPATSGKASGTMDVLPSGPLFLKISISSTISTA